MNFATRLGAATRNIRPAAFIPSMGGIAAALAGALNTLAFAPFGFWPLAIASPLALYLLLRNLDPLAGFFRGAWYGFGFWLAGVSWVYVSIHVYGYTPIPVAIFLTLLFATFLALIFFAWWTALYARLARGVLRPALFVALWVLGEWVRSWLLTGFPWLYQGYAFIDTPLAGFAPVGGVLLVSALVVGIAVLAVDLVNGTRRARIVAVAAIAAFVLGGWGLAQSRWTTPAGAPIPVSLVQGNIPQDMKWLQEMQQPTLDIYNGLSESEWGRRLIVWPEAAVPIYMHEASDLIEDWRVRALASGSTLITGIPYVEQLNGDYVFHNTVLAIDERVTMYHKVKLVPFGEYVPLAPLFRAIAPFFNMPQIPLEGFSPGADAQEPLRAGNTRFAVFLCYEIVYPDYVRRHAANADVLLTVSNDAWFGTSHGPYQHFEIARMRALETGRYLLRGTNTGLTAIIDPQGKVVAQAKHFARTVLRGDVTPMEGATPFMVVGQWPVLGAGFCVLFIAWRRRRPLSA